MSTMNTDGTAGDGGAVDGTATVLPESDTPPSAEAISVDAPSADGADVVVPGAAEALLNTLLAAARADAANAETAAAAAAPEGDAALAPLGAGEEIDLDRTAVSPLAYLADLLNYASTRLRDGSGPVDADWLETRFHQPFGRFPLTGEHTHARVRQARLAAEVLRAHLATLQPRSTARAAALADAERAYRTGAWTFLLERLGTSYGDLRLADEEGLKKIAETVGVPLETLRALALTPPDGVTEAALESFFGLRDTARDPLYEPAERPVVETARLSELRAKWETADRAAAALPIVDPDRVLEAELALPLASNPAHSLWTARRDEIAAADQRIRDARTGAAGDAAAAEALADAAFEALAADFRAAEKERREGGSYAGLLAPLGLAAAEFVRLTDVRTLAADGSGVTAAEWADAEAVAVQAWKRRRHAAWKEAEARAGVVLSPAFFRAAPPPPLRFPPEPDPVFPAWRAPEGDRQAWANRLKDRVEAAAEVRRVLAEAVDAAEERHLPALRDALLRATAPGDGAVDLEARGKAVTDLLLIDTRVDGRRMTTRVAQALETLQSVLFSVRTDQLRDTWPSLRLDAPAFDEEWPWIGEYGAWRSAMFAFLYPENLVVPTTRRRQSEAFRLLARQLRGAALTPDAARELAGGYERYFRDVASLQVECALRVDGVDDGAGAPRALEYAFARTPDGERAYACARAVAGGEVERPWEEIPGVTDVVDMLGAVAHRADGERYAYLFLRLRGEEGGEKLAFTRLHLGNGTWMQEVVALDEPDDASGWRAWVVPVGEHDAPRLGLVPPGEGNVRHVGVNPAGTGWARGAFLHGWQPLGGPPTGVQLLATVESADGSVDLFAAEARLNEDGKRTGDPGRLWHNRQWGPGGGWRGWRPFGPPSLRASALEAARNADGRLEVFAVAGAKVYHSRETVRGGAWDAWAKLAGSDQAAAQIRVAPNSDGRLEIFAVAPDRTTWHAWQTSPNGEWGGWERLGHTHANGVAASAEPERMAVATDGAGKIHVFLVGPQDRVWHVQQTHDGWSDFAVVGSYSQTGNRITATRNGEGRLELFLVGPALEVYRSAQSPRPLPFHGSGVRPGSGDAVALVPTGTGRGYWIVSGDGKAEPHGDAFHFASPVGQPDPAEGKTIVGAVPTPAGGGLWMVADDGTVIARGDARHFGDAAGQRFVRAMAATPSGNGYWVVNALGHVFAFGDARWHGNANLFPINPLRPVVAIASSSTGGGYWLADQDGEVYAFGDAPNHGGSAREIKDRLVGMARAPGSDGYWLVSESGGIFAHGGAPYLGGRNTGPRNKPIIGIAPSPDGAGYWLVAQDGGVFSLPDPWTQWEKMSSGIPGEVTGNLAAAPGPDGRVQLFAMRFLSLPLLAIDEGPWHARDEGWGWSAWSYRGDRDSDGKPSDRGREIYVARGPGGQLTAFMVGQEYGVWATTFEAAPVLPAAGLVPPVAAPLAITEEIAPADLPARRVATEAALAATPDPLKPYLEEAWLHVPLQLAIQLRRAGEHAAALDWLRTVYDYAAGRKVYGGLVLDGGAPESYARAAAWLRDPLDAHEVARARPNAYTRSVLLTLARTALEYADAEFTADTAETVARARTLYLTALELVAAAAAARSAAGPDDVVVGAAALASRSAGAPATVGSVVQAHAGAVAGAHAAVVEAAGGARKLALPGLRIAVDAGEDSGEAAPARWTVGITALASALFRIPPNPALESLRLWAELNLWKIRVGLNIAGVPRELDPYAGPTDAGTGAPLPGGGSAPATRPARPGPYRYATLVERARALVGAAQQMEAAFLSAAEKRDAEAYSLQRARADVEVANGGVRLRDLGVAAAEGGVRLAELQMGRAQLTERHFDDLLDEGLSGEERWAIYLQGAAAALHTAASVVSFAATYQASLSVDSLFSSGSNAASLLASGLSSAAAASSTAAGMLQTIASYERRRQDWEFQRLLAREDVRIAGQQVSMAREQVRIAGQERTIATVQARHAGETVTFLANKFTSLELYDWMAEVLSGVYRTLLQQATAVALAAEAQLRFERQDYAFDAFVRRDYWAAPAEDGAGSDAPERRGLTGSARLLQDLTALDQHAFSTDRRRLQLSRTVSLASLDPVLFQRFRDTGVLEFRTTRRMFDREFPGHYARVIQRVRLSVIALVPPVQGIRATLSTTGPSHVLAAGPRPGSFVEMELPAAAESVALSGAQNASGVFDLDPQGVLRAPFEGLGVETGWRLVMPKAANLFDYSTVADALVTIDYTALEDRGLAERVKADQDGDRAYRAMRPYSFRHTLADQWYDLHNPPVPGTLKVRFRTEARDFPANLRALELKGIALAFSVPELAAVKDLPVRLRFEPESGEPVEQDALVKDGLVATQRGQWDDMVPEGAPPAGWWELTFPDVARARSLFADGTIGDLLFMLEFEGETHRWV